MKIQIDIPVSQLFFIDVPSEYRNFIILNYGYAGTWLMETDSNRLNHWKVHLPNGNYEVLEFVKDVIPQGSGVDKNFVLRKI